MKKNIREKLEDETCKEPKEIALTFEQKKELMTYEHTLNLETLAYIRETERKKHEWELERQRIKSAEIRRSQIRRGDENAFKY